MIIPKRLKPNDLIRIISPSRSLSIIPEEVKKNAEQRLKNLGFRISYSEFAYEIDEFSSSSIEFRVQDIHNAFLDKEVKGILTSIGGFNCNQLLNYLDFDLIKRNPKIFCGFSDITALSNAIYNKTGLVCYSGPHFSSFGMAKGFSYSEEHFIKCVSETTPISISASLKWSDDIWFKDQENRSFIENSGVEIISEGITEGTIIGGNLCTFNLLQGTDFQPSLKNSILFLEDDSIVGSFSLSEFDRNLQSIIHLPDFSEIKGIIIGRFQKNSKVSINNLKKVIKSKAELKSLPILCNVDFGHTTPIITFPIGGKVSIEAKDKKIKILIIDH